MNKVPAVLFLLVLVSATLAIATGLPARDEAPADEAAPAAEVTEAVEPSEAAEPEFPIAGECNVAEPGEDTKVLTGFGPHCGPSFTCTHREPGLGFGCTCTYSCSCAYCNGQLVKINCQLVDDGGCFACPM